MNRTSIQRNLLRAYLNLYGWATHRLYAELAWAYDPIAAFVSAGRWERWRRYALEYVTGPRVLEVGFGTGELLFALQEAGLDVCGLELSPAMQRVTARKVARRGVRLPRVRARAQALPFAAGSFDTVVATFPAEYIIEPVTLADIRRVLRPPAGRLVIAGLSVDLPLSPRFPLSWLPSSWEPLYAFFQARALAAGFVTEVLWHADPPARVPVVVGRLRE